MTRIEFPHGVVLEWHPQMRKCITRFADGTEAHACPHFDAAYRNHAAEKSTGSVDEYCWQHDLLHQWSAINQGRPYSVVLWNLAHSLPVDTEECQQEEAEAQDLQRKFFLRR